MATTIKIPTPLRTYTGENAEVSVEGDTIKVALDNLLEKYPDLRQHLFNGSELRNFVNIFVGEEDIRFREGLDTPVEPGEKVRIIPTIAGGSDKAQKTDTVRRVDHSALRTNQAFIIALLILGFALNAPLLVAFVAAVMLVGTVVPTAGLFKLVYSAVLKPAGIVKPDVKIDNPEPHLFAQGFGGVVLLLATLTFLANVAVAGWILVWLVVALAALNLFAGVCVGCMMYYQLNRFGVRGFDRAPISQ